jgi:hypothetical protein
MADNPFGLNSSQRPPRGFVTLADAADLLIGDDTAIPAAWAEAYIRMVADSQGSEELGAAGKLPWWHARLGGPLYVRARGIAPLYPFFLKWCGILSPSDAPEKPMTRTRGRPKGSAIASDEGLINEAIQLIRDGKANSPTDAARQVSSRAVGASDSANFDRLRRKIKRRLTEPGKK